MYLRDRRLTDNPYLMNVSTDCDAAAATAWIHSLLFLSKKVYFETEYSQLENLNLLDKILSGILEKSKRDSLLNLKVFSVLFNNL